MSHQPDFSTLIDVENPQPIIVVFSSMPYSSENQIFESLQSSDVSVICDSQHRELYSQLLPFKKPEKLMIKITPENVTSKVILLMRDQNRVNHVDQHLRLVFPTLQIAPAIDAMTPHAIDNSVRTHQIPILKPIRAGKIGCIFSHITLWKKFLASSGSAAMLVMEDDIIPVDDFHERFDLVLEELPPTFDLLYLHLDENKNYGLRPGSDYSLLLKRNIPREDTCAYLISRKGTAKLIKIFATIKDVLGSTIRKQIESGTLETYTVKNALFTNIGQKTCYQDLEQGMLKSNTCHSQYYVPEETIEESSMESSEEDSNQSNNY